MGIRIIDISGLSDESVISFGAMGTRGGPAPKRKSAKKNKASKRKTVKRRKTAKPKKRKKK